MGRIKNKTIYPLKANPALDDFIIGTDYESGETINFSVDSIAGNANTVADNNKFIEINYGKFVGDGITSPDIASAINSLPVPIEILYDEIPVFNGIVYDGTRSYYNSYYLVSKGKGIYGVGGNITVTSAELRIIASTLINHEDYVTPDPNAVLTDLGDITGTSLLDTLNAATPFPIAVDENRYWKYLDGGQEYIYGFSGAAGTYGAAQPAILITELFLVRDFASAIVTTTSDLLNNGSDATSTYVETDELGAAAFDNQYSSLTGTPAAPTLQIAVDGGNTATSADTLSGYIMDISEAGAGFFRVKMDNVGVTKGTQIWGDSDFVRLSGFGVGVDAEVKIDSGLLTLQQSSGANATNIGFITPIAVTTFNFPAKTIGTYTIATLGDVTASSGLEVITETTTGWRLVGAVAADFGDIGTDAVDFTQYGDGTQGALGTASFSAGSYNTSGAYTSATFGESNTIPVGADFTFLAGNLNVVAAAALASAGFGKSNTLNNLNTFAANLNNTVNGDQASAFGRDNFTQSFGEFALGIYGTDYTRNAANSFTIDVADRILNIGIGTSTIARADALTILKSGEITAPSLTTAIIDAEATGKVLITKESYNFAQMFTNDSDSFELTVGGNYYALSQTVSGGTWQNLLIDGTSISDVAQDQNNWRMSVRESAVNGGNAGLWIEAATTQRNLTIFEEFNTFRTTVAFTTPTADVTLNFPALTVGTYTLATTADIGAVGLEEVLDVDNTAWSDDFGSFLKQEYIDGGLGTMQSFQWSASEYTDLYQTKTALYLYGQVGSKYASVDLNSAALTMYQSDVAGTNRTNIAFAVPTTVTTLNFPAKTTGTYTIATTADATLQAVTDFGAITTNPIEIQSVANDRSFEVTNGTKNGSLGISNFGNPDIRLHDGTNLNVYLGTDSGGSFFLNNVAIGKSTAGAILDVGGSGNFDGNLTVSQNTTTTTLAQFKVLNLGTGDSFMGWRGGTNDYSVGIDNSDADTWKISTGTTLANAVIAVTTAGDIDLTGTVSLAGSYGEVLNDVTTTRNLILTDANDTVTMSNGAAVSCVIPANASVAYPIGTRITLINLGAGTVTVSITTDTLNGNVGGLTMAQYDKRTLIKVTATSWILGY